MVRTLIAKYLYRTRIIQEAFGWKKGIIFMFIEAGHKATALYIMDLFSKEVQKELKERGCDLRTLKFSINKIEGWKNAKC